MADADDTFSLSGLGLKLDSDSDVAAHVKPLLANPKKITYLDLSGNTIGVPAAEALAPHLSALTNLQVANLADIFTSRLLSEIPPALSALLDALLQCKKLHTVNLSDNAFGLNTQAPLVKFLQQHTPLRHLILNNNGLGPEAGTLVANALAALAQAKSAAGEVQMLETLVCGRNRLENGSSAAWAQALHAHARHLREVRMSQNGIRMEGTQAILRLGLKEAQNLELLDLQDNLFTVSAGQALAEVLPGWPRLRELQVADTLLGARGGILLGQALAGGANKQVQTLRLQYNEIDAKGVQALVDAVNKECLPDLQRVELNGNKFAEEDSAVEALGEILNDRKEEAGVDGEDESWGLDELDELEDESEDEEEGGEDEDEQELQDKADKDLKQADEAESENVALENDNDVDALAERLGNTEI